MATAGLASGVCGEVVRPRTPVHDPDQLRRELVAGGCLNEGALAAARVAQTAAPHLSLHLLARGSTAWAASASPC